MSPSQEDIRLERRDGVAFVTICRPERLNALSPPAARELREKLQKAVADEEAKVLVLSGSPPAFCAGADLTCASAGVPEGTFENDFNGMIHVLVESPKPVIARIDGPAVGYGMSLALACDFRVCTPASYFCLAFAKIGLIPDGGATWLLPRLVGVGRAMEMTLTAQQVDADSAARMGLVGRVVPPEELDGAVGDLAQRLARGPGLAYALGKECIQKGLECNLKEALNREMKYQLRLIGSEDFSEGVSAFLEHRKAVFRGR
ncbi:MAG: enoyl-CoA hydratase [Nitrospirae bacterium]|nr:enoyl-CoA hydratase [Nitrospirota bacterium]